MFCKHSTQQKKAAQCYLKPNIAMTFISMMSFCKQLTVLTTPELKCLQLLTGQYEPKRPVD